MLQSQIQVYRVEYVEDPLFSDLLNTKIKRRPLQPRNVKQYPLFAEFYISYDVSNIQMTGRQLLFVFVFNIAANMPVDFLVNQIQTIFVLDRSNFGILSYFSYLFYNYVSALIGASLSIYFNRVQRMSHATACMLNLYLILLFCGFCLLNIYNNAVIAQILISFGFFKYNLQIASSALVCKLAPLSCQQIVFHFGHISQLLTYVLSDISYVQYEQHLFNREKDIVSQRIQMQFKQLMQTSITNCVMAIVICTFCLQQIEHLLGKYKKRGLNLKQRNRFFQFSRNFQHSREYLILCGIYVTMQIACIDQIYINTTINVKFYFLRPIDFLLIFHGSALFSAVFCPLILQKVGYRPVFLLVFNIVLLIGFIAIQLQPTYIKAVCFAVFGVVAAFINPLTKQIFGAFSRANNIDFAYFIGICLQNVICIGIPILFNGGKDGDITLFFGNLRLISGTAIICAGTAMLLSLLLNVVNVRKFSGMLNNLK